MIGDRMLSLTTISVKLLVGNGRAKRASVQCSNGDQARARQRPSRVAAADIAGANKLALGQLDHHLGYFLRRLQIWVFQDFIQTLRPMKVRPAQYSVLLIIEANPGRSQAAIGQALGIERARLARMLHELERRNWVSRRANGSDARSHSLLFDGARRKGAVQQSSVWPKSTRPSLSGTSVPSGTSSSWICCATSADGAHSTSYTSSRTRVGLALPARQRQNAVEPVDRRVGGLEPHHGAEIIKRRIDALAARQPLHDRGRTVPQPVARAPGCARRHRSRWCSAPGCRRRRRRG